MIKNTPCIILNCIIIKNLPRLSSIRFSKLEYFFWELIIFQWFLPPWARREGVLDSDQNPSRSYSCFSNRSPGNLLGRPRPLFGISPTGPYLWWSGGFHHSSTTPKPPQELVLSMNCKVSPIWLMNTKMSINVNYLSLGFLS